MSTSAQAPKSAHVPALDGLRAVAILAVFEFHAFSTHPTFGLSAPVRLGKYGVTVFFVLSGFLITLRLFAAVDRDDLSQKDKWRTFFVRRAARIFPLYYATALLLALFGARLHFANKASMWPWLLTYTLNFRIADNLLSQGRWFGPGHLWSLCVEEQFYLVFPLFVLTGLRRWLVPLVVATALASVALRVAVAMTDDPLAINALWVLPAAHLDAFGVGIGAALCTRTGARAREQWARGSYWTGLAAAAAAVAIALLPAEAQVAGALFPTALSVVTVAVILGAWRGELRLLVAPLASRPLVSLGRISYGFYVFHLFVVQIVLRPKPPWLAPAGLVRAAFAFAVSVALAAVSWRFFERPLLEWGRRLEPAPDAAKRGEAS